MVKRYQGPAIVETDDSGNNPVSIFIGPDKSEIRSDSASYAATVVGAAGAAVAQMSAVPAALTGTTSETTLATITLPSLGANDGVRVTLNWSFTSSVNLKSMFVKINGSTFAQNSTSTSGHTASRMEVMVMNRNNTASQLGSIFGFGYTAGAAVTFLNPTVETSGSNTITIRAQLASSSETITLEGYVVQVVRAL